MHMCLRTLDVESLGLHACYYIKFASDLGQLVELTRKLLCSEVDNVLVPAPARCRDSCLWALQLESLRTRREESRRRTSVVNDDALDAESDWPNEGKTMLAVCMDASSTMPRSNFSQGTDALRVLAVSWMWKFTIHHDSK